MNIEKKTFYFNCFIALLLILVIVELNAQDTSYSSTGAIKEVKVYSGDANTFVLYRYNEKQRITAKEIYDKGKISSAERYEQSDRNGGVLFTIVTFYENGSIAEMGKCSWAKSHHSIDENCLRIGKWRTFYENGQLKDVGSYSHFRERTGKWKSYYENGCLAEKGRYNDAGECIGKWRFYDTKGKLARTYSYDER